LLIALAGCSLFPGQVPTAAGLDAAGLDAAGMDAAGTQTAGTPTAQSSPEGTAVQQQTAPAGTPAGLTPSTSSSTTLKVWLPPEFNPQADTEAGRLLRERIRAFEEANGVQVQVRVKDADGPGSLLEALTAASAAAPLALPSLVALPRSDLEVAALKGLIVPLDGLSTQIDEPDWYAYARSLAMVQGTAFALPFAGDALVVVYRPGRVVAPPDSWDAIFRLGQPVAFPASDAQALTVLALYRSLGGEIEDAQRRPILSPEALTPVLQLVADAEERGMFPFWLSQYETFSQVWQAYTEERVNVAVVWSSSYLAGLPADSSAMPLPPLVGGKTAVKDGAAQQTLATGWGWAVADPMPERRVLAARLAEYLTAGDFLASWTEAAGYLPTRPSSLASWSNGALKTLFSPIAASAQARPSNDLVSSEGPALREAVLKMLKREATPEEAARAASDRLAAPQSR